MIALVHLTNGGSLIRKLVTGALFVAIEGANPLSTVKALGANRWSDVTCILDASVAIPYLCARLHRASSDRFAETYVRLLRELSRLGAELSIPEVYIKESSAHLLRASDYRWCRGFDNELS